MFRRVRSIQSCGVYKNYVWPSNLPEFSGRNLIYGWNYCGKTTLSRVFRAVEVRHTGGLPEGSRFSLELIDGGELLETDVARGPAVTVRVFNADFVEENLLWAGGAQPLLVLGAENVLLEAEREALAAKLRKVSDWKDRVERRKQRCEAKRDEALSSIALKVKLRAKLGAFNRTPHLASVLSASGGDYEKGILGEEEFARYKSIYESEQRTALSKVVVRELVVGDPYQIFLKTASRVAIAKIVEKEGLERWVLQGLNFHEAGSECGFCGGEVSCARWELLGAHFSGAVTELLHSIDSTVTRLADFKAAPLPAASDLYEDLRPRFNGIALAIRRIEERVTLRLGTLIAALNDKKTRVEESYSCTRRPVSRLLVLRESLVGELNELIGEHNRRVSAGGSAREEAKRCLVLHYACAGVLSSGVTTLQKESTFLAAWASRSAGIRGGIQNRLINVEKKIEAASIGIEKVNQYIRLYFGSDRLKVESISGRYRVYRESEIAATLSEGEKTAISFAYFMARLEERDVNLSNTIVYIDDPVSSLDANHIFNTFSILRAKLSGCAQLFVSTHHYEFFRLMKDDSFFREWNDKKAEKRRSSYYRVVRIEDESKIEDLPLTLRRYTSEYQLLVSTLFDFDAGAGIPPHMIPNVLRRVLEAYTSFRFPSNVETLDNRLARIFPDPVVSAKVYKLINHLSHASSPNVIFELPADEEVREVVKTVLRRLREFDEEHFVGLESVVTTTN